jgi:hypothetical protein
LHLAGEINLSKFNLSAEKQDIFALAVTAFCLLFYDVRASEISDLKKGPALIKSLLEKIKDKDLAFILEKMINFEFEDRYTI